MPPPTVPSLEQVAQRREPLGLLFFNAQGRLLGFNPIARQILHQNHPGSSLSKQIRSGLKHLVRDPDAPPAPFLQTTFTSGKRHYGLRAFLLDHPPGQRSPHVAVLLERINPSRLDCSKAQRVFGLSRREGEVIHHLELGLTDKEIASALGIGSETVRAHLKNIRAKLSVSTRTAILNKLLSL